MKILSDFDGVMTDQTEEGLFEAKLFRDKLAELSGQAETVDALIAEAQAELAQNPTAHGWWSNNRVSAYADEDLFIKVIGTAVCLDKWAEGGRDDVGGILAGVRDKSDFACFAKVSDWAYFTMANHTSSGGLKPMDPIVANVIHTLLDAGHDIVVVSNSATDRVVELLETIDLQPVKHSDDPTARFRVRGDARKFTLADEADAFGLDGFTFDVARPHFRKILEDETPDVAIGDVFSLDLALPLYLTRTETERFGGMHLLLRTRHYTPEWSKKICTRTDEVNAKLGLLDEFGKLPQVIGVT